jgi:hypothetical protein
VVTVVTVVVVLLRRLRQTPLLLLRTRGPLKRPARMTRIPRTSKRAHEARGQESSRFDFGICYPSFPYPYLGHVRCVSIERKPVSGDRRIVDDGLPRKCLVVLFLDVGI